MTLENQLAEALAFKKSPTENRLERGQRIRFNTDLEKEEEI